MGDSLQKRIDSLVKQVFGAGTGAWLVWCDSQREWEPLLDRVATDRRLGGFPLVKLEEHTAGSFGGPLARKQVQEQIERGESFVLYAPVNDKRTGVALGTSVAGRSDLRSIAAARSCLTGVGAPTR